MRTYINARLMTAILLASLLSGCLNNPVVLRTLVESAREEMHLTETADSGVKILAADPGSNAFTSGEFSANWYSITIKITDSSGAAPTKSDVGPIALDYPETLSAVVALLSANDDFKTKLKAEADGGKLKITPTAGTTSIDGATIQLGSGDGRARAREIARIEDLKKQYEEFLGFHLGVGVGFSADLGGRSRVDEAEIVNGVVRVKQKSMAIPRILLETHYFITPDFNLFGLVPMGLWGVGPFIGIQASTEEIIDSFAGGLMVGLRRADLSQSLNVGIGAILDRNAKTLGGGFRDGQPPPAGESTVRFRENSRWALGFFVSVGF